MLHCQGQHKKRIVCNRVVYRCKACGAAGCDQNQQAECKGQNFLHGKCLKCGSMDNEPGDRRQEPD